MTRFGIGTCVYAADQLGSALKDGSFRTRNISVALYPQAQALSEELPEEGFLQLAVDVVRTMDIFNPVAGPDSCRRERD